MDNMFISGISLEDVQNESKTFTALFIDDIDEIDTPNSIDAGSFTIENNEQEEPFSFLERSLIKLSRNNVLPKSVDDPDDIVGAQ